MVAVVDRDILGKIFKEGNRQLDLTAAFYQGTAQAADEVKRSIRGADVIHVIGNASVALARRERWIEGGRVLTVQRIPHAQALAPS